MKTKIDALYDLAKKVAGSAKKDDSIVEMIDQITAGYSSGGGESIEVIANFNTVIYTLQDDDTITDTEDIALLNAFLEGTTTAIGVVCHGTGKVAQTKYYYLFNIVPAQAGNNASVNFSDLLGNGYAFTLIDDTWTYSQF